MEQTPVPSGLATAPMMKVEPPLSPAIPPYAAPQVSSEPPVVAGAQSYSLGVVLAAMAFGVTLGSCLESCSRCIAEALGALGVDAVHRDL